MGTRGAWGVLGGKNPRWSSGGDVAFSRTPLGKAGWTESDSPTDHAQSDVTGGASLVLAPKPSTSFLHELACLSSSLYGGRNRVYAWPPARRLDPRALRLVLWVSGDPGRSPGP